MQIIVAIIINVVVVVVVVVVFFWGTSYLRTNSTYVTFVVNNQSQSCAPLPYLYLLTCKQHFKQNFQVCL